VPKPKQPPLKPEGIIDVPKDDNKNEKTDIDLGTTEIHIDEQGNLHTEDSIPMPAQLPAAPQVPVHHEQPSPLPAQTLSAPTPIAPSLSPPPLPAPPPPPIIQPHPAPEAPPSAEPTLPPPEPIPTVKPPSASSPHAFIGGTAQPAGMGIPFPNTGQPDWAAPYDLASTDPLRDVGASTSEFGSAPVTHAPEEGSGNFSQGHAIQPPSVNPVDSPLDNARSAVESALAAAPFDPAFHPVEGLQTQSFNNNEPIHAEAPNPVIQMPPLQASDTPMLVLPNGGQGVSTNQVPQTDSAAPPPIPPPLVAGPGVIVPNPPKQ
jgi:hypothetical protein